MNLGKAIKLCRTQKDMKQSELADLAQISVSYLSLLEQGKRDPNISTVENIATALNIPISILVFLAAERGEIPDISQELAEKLSYTALQLIGASNNGSSSIPE
jgi:transcriptional regulator with XRE-family HTH domain